MISTPQRLALLAQVVVGIERRQENEPGVDQDVLEAIVNHELKRLEVETAMEAER